MSKRGIHHDRRGHSTYPCDKGDTVCDGRARVPGSRAPSRTRLSENTLWSTERPNGTAHHIIDTGTGPTGFGLTRPRTRRSSPSTRAS